LSTGLKLFVLFASVSKQFLRVQFYYRSVEDAHNQLNNVRGFRTNARFLLT